MVVSEEEELCIYENGGDRFLLPKYMKRSLPWSIQRKRLGMDLSFQENTVKTTSLQVETDHVHRPLIEALRSHRKKSTEDPSLVLLER